MVVLKSNNLQYNKLGCWVHGTIVSSTKCLMFHVLFFFIISCKILNKNPFILFSFLYNFAKVKIKSFECPKSKSVTQSPSQSAPTILVLKTRVGLWHWEKIGHPVFWIKQGAKNKVIFIQKEKRPGWLFSFWITMALFFAPCFLKKAGSLIF